MQRRGFVLLIVLGLLGILAYVALDLAQLARTSIVLSTAQMDKSRSRVLARSGVERALRQIRSGSILGSMIPNQDVSIGDGTYCTSGDRAIYTVRDASGCLDLNDGIAAGLAEWGPAIYKANAIDWDSDTPPKSEEDVLIDPDESLSFIDLPPIDSTHLWSSNTVPNYFKVGDRIKVLDFYDSNTGLLLDLEFNVVSIGAAWGGTLLESDVPMPIDNMDHICELWRAPPYTGPPLPFRSRINVRPRTVLNALGDVHRFLATLGEPVAKRSDFTGAAPYGTSFSYSSTTLKPFGHALPSVDVRTGLDLTDLGEVARWGRGLGDRIIAARPASGYRNVHEVEDVVNSWGRDLLPASYVAGTPFFERIKGSLTVGADPDRSFSRMSVRQWVSDLEPQVSEFGTRDVVQGPNWHPSMFMPMHLGTRAPNMRNMFSPHPVSLINLNAASFETRAAVFGALVNVGYLCEGSRSLQPFSMMYLAATTPFRPNVAMAQTSIGVSGPVLRRETYENGVASPTPSEARALFMSLRDALALSRNYEVYGAGVMWPRTFDQFRTFLEWNETEGVAYEKCDSPVIPYSDDIFTGGFFTQDYVRVTLPHVLSCIRRIPGYMGAPEALLSPYTTQKGYKVMEPEGMWQDDPSKMLQAEHSGTHPTRKVEDFVSRYLLPKVSFLPTGIHNIAVMGVVLGQGPVERASTRLSLVAKGDFKGAAVRSQREFVIHTDPATSPSIFLGPENSRSPDHPHAHLGFIGLKDFEEPLEGAPQLIAHFNGHVTGDPGVSRIYAVSGDGPASYAKYDPVTNGYAGTDPVVAPFGLRQHGSLEWATQPLFHNESKGSDLSPFGGVLISSKGNGLSDGGVNIEDMLYWRPMNGSDPNAPIKDNITTGSQAGKGHLTLWVRLPSTHTGVSDPEHYGDKRFISRMDYKAIAQLSLIEFVKADMVTFVVQPRPTTITLGVGFDDVLKRYVFVARYGTRDGDNSAGSHYCWGNRGSNLGWPGTAFSDPTVDHDNTMILNNYFSGAYDDWRRLGANEWYLNERWCTLKNPITHPECGAGTWHKVSMGWNSHWHNNDPLGNFWLRVRDGSNVDNYGMHSWRTLTDVGGPYSDHPNIHAHNILFTLGNLYSAEYGLGMYAFTLPGYPWSSDALQFTQQLWDGNANNCEGNSLPLYLLDSLVDNVTLQLGSLPPILDHFDALGYLGDPSRYDVSSEPAWIFDPHGIVPEGAKIVAVGARVYDPRNSSQNFPDVELSLMDGAGVVPDTSSAIGGSAGSQRTEHLKFYDKRPLQPLSRVRLKYLNRNPLGQPLQEAMNEIPWILEVSLRWTDDKPLVLSGWKED